MTTLAIVAGVMWLLVMAWSWYAKRRPPSAARRMPRTKSLGVTTARKTASRLGVDTPGIRIGRSAQNGRALLQGWEDCSLDIAGPRTGKTTCRVAPAILEAPGVVVTTSNKRDSLDATRDARAKRGPVWIFDPQQVAGEPPSWWWNPLSYVTDEVKAAELADVFAAAHRDPQSRSDAFFEPKGHRLVAALLLAAAVGRRQVDMVYRWVTDPDDDEPVALLRDHGHSLMADFLQAEQNTPAKQRAGVYGTSERTLGFLTSHDALAWVTPGDGRVEFDADAFVRGTGTLYSLSREGKASAGALVAGMTVAVTEAAEALAKTSPNGRLPVPMVVVLDEAANVCRWPELPNQYSHYGSRGIALMTFLQSWSQGSEVWTDAGMRKLWGAATIRVLGAGIAEAGFLEDCSRLVGEHDEPHVTVGHARGQRTSSRTVRRTRILDVAALAGLKHREALVFSAGGLPQLARLRPYWSKR